MSNSKRIPVSLLVLALTALACSLPGIPAAPDEDAIATYIARTMTAAAGLTASAAPPASDTPLAPSPTSTPEPPTLTPTITLTVTPFSSPTPLTPMISVSVATNCRVGPGKVYAMVGALLVGETAQVLARDPTGQYWYIPNPDSPGEFCWVWGEYAALTGNTSVLPVYTPPPTPTPSRTPTPAPDFSAGFASLEECSGSWWVNISLENDSPATFRSMGLKLIDRDTDVEATNFTDGFTERDGCSSTSTRDVIEPGRVFTVSSSVFAYNLDNHEMRARVTLCTNTGQGGTCITKVVNFKP
jgi:hypothetical protein